MSCYERISLSSYMKHATQQMLWKLQIYRKCFKCDLHTALLTWWLNHGDSTMFSWLTGHEKHGKCVQLRKSAILWTKVFKTHQCHTITQWWRRRGSHYNGIQFQKFTRITPLEWIDKYCSFCTDYVLHTKSRVAQSSTFWYEIQHKYTVLVALHFGQ